MAIVVVSVYDKFLIGKESRFLRDIYPDVRHQERFQLPGDYMKYYKNMCKKLTQKYGMRIQFDIAESQMAELDAMRQDLELMNDRQFIAAYGMSKRAFQQK